MNSIYQTAKNWKDAAVDTVNTLREAKQYLSKAYYNEYDDDE